MAGETGVDQAAAIRRLDNTLSDSQAVCLQLDIVIGYALDLVRFLTAPGSAARQQLIATWSGALAGLEADDTLNICDQLSALRTRVRLTRLGAADTELVAAASARVAEVMALVQPPALRHAIVNSGAGVLADAGLLDAAQQLLQGELAQARAPYFLLHSLAALAKRRGQPAAALECYEQAWACAVGGDAAAVGRGLPAGAA